MYGLKYVKLGVQLLFISTGGLVIMSDTGYAPSAAEIYPQSKSEVTAKLSSRIPSRDMRDRNQDQLDHGAVCSALAFE
jgi:hypothetical protein